VRILSFREAPIKIYLAGPLGFSEAGRAFHQTHIIPLLEKLGHTLLDPWADQGNTNDVLKLPFGIERRDAWRMLNPKIGHKNQLTIDECDAIFAVLDGTDVDSGTAAEIGYGFARGKKILGYRGDFRLSADNEGGIVNLQVEYFIRASGGDIVFRLDDVPAALIKLA
jgi:nucleoside 2-deoxyribosyltransferase